MPDTWVLTACGSMAGPGIGNGNGRLFMAVRAARPLVLAEVLVRLVFVVVVRDLESRLSIR